MEHKRFRVRKRTIVGGLVAAGIVIGALMSGLLPGFGSGSGIGDGTQVAISATSSSSVVPPDDNTDIISAPDRMPKEARVLVVVIKEESYFVRTVVDGNEKIEPADLDRIVELAKATSGNKDGIRVNILRDESARFLTWKTLQEELAKAGLPSDSVELSRLNGE